MVELVDTLSLGGSALQRGGSNPSIRTKIKLFTYAVLGALGVTAITS